MSSAQPPYPDEPPPPARGLTREERGRDVSEAQAEVEAETSISVYGVLWVVFAPMRLWMKKNRPDDYAASQSK